MKANLLIVGLLFLSFLVPVTIVSAENISTPQGVIIAHYPDKFDEVGTVYSISERGIVVDDMFIHFASRVKYMTPQNAYSSLGSFRQGQTVGYQLNDENQITSLYLLWKSSLVD